MYDIKPGSVTKKSAPENIFEFNVSHFKLSHIREILELGKKNISSSKEVKM